MTTKKVRTSIFAIAMLVTVTGFAWAHHALIAEFDVNKSVTLRGTITKMEWKNPHGWIYIDVKRPNGRVENWMIETGSPFRMTKQGLSAGDFRPGAEIIVGGFPAKTLKNALAGWVVTFPTREKSDPEHQATFVLGR